MNITIQDIKEIVPNRIYQRGYSYYRSGRVQLIETEPDYFKAVVSGTHDYLVEVHEVEEGWFEGECNCPYWEDCKHIVAAMLAAKDYYDEQSARDEERSDSDWKKYLKQIDQDPLTQTQAKKKWQLLFTLEMQPEGWQLHPHKVLIKKDGSFGVLHELGYNDFSETNIIRSRTDNLVLSFLDKWKQENSFNRYYYQWRTIFKFKYGERVGFLFNSLRESLVYFRARDDLGQQVCFNNQKAKIEFRLSEEQETATFLPYLIFNNKETAFDHSFYILSADPIWLLKGEELVEIEGMNNAAILIPFTRENYDVRIPKEEVAQFLNAVASQLDLFENFRLPEGSSIITSNEITRKHLYLEEIENGIEIKLSFCYGNVEVDLNDSRSILWDSCAEENSFIKVERNTQRETEALQLLLNTSVKLRRDGRILTRKNKTLEWLIDETPRLLSDGFVIYGEQNLKRYKVNRSTAQVRVAVESGLDWFDLNMDIDFGGVLLSLKELQKALKQKSRYVKLADGSTAQLPKPWLDRFRHVLNLGETDKNKLKLSHFHVTLIDELFAEAHQKDFDEPFYEKLNNMKDFEGIKDVSIPESLQGKLRPYQAAGYNWLHFLKEFQFGGCLADDMGLGKTIQALALLSSENLNGERTPNLIVTPTSVIFNWLDEIKRFAPELRVYNQTGADRERTSKNYGEFDIILTSYGTLRRDIVFLKDVEFNYVILDESQQIKNPISQSAKAARLLKANHRLALTGTPVENNTIELWSLFSFLNPGLLGNLNYFKNAFARPIEKENDNKTVELLRKMIYPFILRRTKENVETDLPPKVENIIYCEMSPQQQKLYNQWRDYFRASLLKQITEIGMDKTRMNVLEGLMKLRQIACHPKLVEKEFSHNVGKFDNLVEYVDEILAEGHKILVFSQFVKMLTIIRNYLDQVKIDYEYLDGKTRDRKACVERFQNESACKIFLISLRAGGTGLNLTAADYVIHYDPWWNPAVELQATDRTHRIGQNKHVFVYRMISKGTVEEKILQLQARKKELVSNIIGVDAGLFKQLTTEDIEILFS